MATIEPRFENHVSLDPARRDSFGVPLLKVQFSYSSQDKAVIRELTASIRSAAGAMGLDFYENPSLLPPGLDNHEAGRAEWAMIPPPRQQTSMGKSTAYPVSMWLITAFCGLPEQLTDINNRCFGNSNSGLYPFAITGMSRHLIIWHLIPPTLKRGYNRQQKDRNNACNRYK